MQDLLLATASPSNVGEADLKKTPAAQVSGPGPCADALTVTLPLHRFFPFIAPMAS